MSLSLARSMTLNQHTMWMSPYKALKSYLHACLLACLLAPLDCSAVKGCPWQPGDVISKQQLQIKLHGFTASCAGIPWQLQLETHYEQSLESGETILKALGIVTATVY